MQLGKSLAITRNEVRILRRDPSPLILVIVVPLIVVTILRTAIQASLDLAGFHNVPGSNFEVPAEIVTFAFFIPAFTAIAFFREHGWGTWDRLRSSPATASEILLGKVLPSVGLGVLQIGVVVAIGILLLGMDVRGSILGFLVIASALVVCVSTAGLAMTALCRTVQQVNAVANAGSVGLAAVGGALVPLFTLPIWIRHLAPATPQYWAMRGFNSVVLDGRGISSAWVPTLVLLAFSLGFSALAAWRLRFGEQKVGWG